MRRGGLGILGFGLLGVFATIAVAWGVALLGTFDGLPRSQTTIRKLPGGEPGALDFRERALVVGSVHRFGACRRMWVVVHHNPMVYSHINIGQRAAPRGSYSEDDLYTDASMHWGRLPEIFAQLDEPATESLPKSIEDARGWPFLALWCEISPTVNSGSDPYEMVSGGLGLAPMGGAPMDRGSIRAIPCKPIWLGFLANSAIYALLAFCVSRLAGLGRMAIRSRRGHCIACGYDVRESPSQCPECGGERARNLQAMRERLSLWRRIISRGLLALGLGVATTVAIAWVLAWRFDPRTGPQFGDVEDGPAMRVRRQSSDIAMVRSSLAIWNSGVTRRTWLSFERDPNNGRLISSMPASAKSHGAAREHWEDWLRINRDIRWISTIRGYVDPVGPSTDLWWNVPQASDSGLEQACGWPMRALWCRIDPLPWAEDDPVVTEGGWALSAHPGPEPLFARVRILPYRPLWSGALANTGVFATGWLALLIGFASLRRKGTTHATA